MRRAIVTLVIAGLCGSAALADGSIKGKATFKGEPPKTSGPKINFGADANCDAMHATPAYQELLVVNPNNTVRDVFVYVKEGVAKKEWPIPPAASIDQQGCMYHPHVLGVMAGQIVTVKNSDNTSHNIHAMPKTNAEFNFGQPRAGMTKDETFKTPELAVKVKCDVHPWMGAWVHVMEHPFFAVTGVDGAFEIKGLPAGKYKLAIWHEHLGEQVMDVVVEDGAAKEVEFTLERKKP